MFRKRKYNNKSKNNKKDSINDNKKEISTSIENESDSRDYIDIINELLIGLLVANGMAVITSLIGVYINLTLSAFVLILACIPIAILSGMYSMRLITLFIFTAMLGISVSYLAWEYNALTSGKTIKRISVNMTPQYQDASVFVFTDAIVRSEYMGKKIYRRAAGGAKQSSYRLTYAVPLVSPDWTKNQPIPAWAICTKIIHYVSEIANPPSSLFNNDFKMAVATEEDDSKDAIEDACKKFGLMSNENARVLRLVYSLEEEIDETVSLLKGFVIGFNVVWIIIFLIMAFSINEKDYMTKASDS